MANKIETKLRAGKYWIKSTLTFKDNRVFIGFPYSKALLPLVKNLQGAKYHGFDPVPRKIWSVPVCQHNTFRLAFMQGKDVFARYDAPIPAYISARPLREHQLSMVAACIQRKGLILAGEMGTGKTLVAIEVMEYIKKTEGLEDFEAWYIGPRSGVRAVGREINKWDSTVKPLMYTYEGLTKMLINDDVVIPKIIILDESSKLKNASAKRTQAAVHAADAIREKGGYVIEMTGTPAPKDPTNWHSQAHIACPGYLIESHVAKMKARLCITEERQGAAGMYPHVVTWLDDENKCAKCGEMEDHVNHDENATIFGGDDSKIHEFKPSINEVAKLYTRLSGLVDIKLKKDCLDLPEKQYRIIKVSPSQETLRAAKLIKAKSPRAITALTLLRELSDGFQYGEEVVGELECPECYGEGVTEELVPDEAPDLLKATDYSGGYTEATMTCPLCQGNKVVPKYKRITDGYSSPKDQVYLDFLDEYSEVGRFVVWGGFTGTVDRLVELSHQHGWCTLRYDKLVQATNEYGVEIPVDDLLDAMDNSHPRYEELRELYPKVTFVGNPDAGGMALTLHASPIALYYSNTFNGESRIQSEDRIHRMGMDNNRGAMIVDLIHLKSDLLVLDNLKNKKKLQNMTLNVLNDAFISSDLEMERYE
ncbi:MAG: DEAD/DEAH box helicase [Dehalococcoidia bacterium]|nr:MAG: DEAD/DEAH box helicase [Dehalococcoidia bacterium]